MRGEPGEWQVHGTPTRLASRGLHAASPHLATREPVPASLISNVEFAGWPCRMAMKDGLQDGLQDGHEGRPCRTAMKDSLQDGLQDGLHDEK